MGGGRKDEAEEELRGLCLPREREREREPELKPTKLTSKRFSATAEQLISNLGIRLERLHGPYHKKTDFHITHQRV